MTELKLTDSQLQISSKSRDGKVFLTGLAGSGKTTAALQWIRNLAEQSIPLDSLLILVPQRSLAAGYYDLISSAEFPAGSLPTIVTFPGLAQRMVDLFWTEIAKTAGFVHLNRPPRFLTLETSQYFYGKDY